MKNLLISTTALILLVGCGSQTVKQDSRKPAQSKSAEDISAAATKYSVTVRPDLAQRGDPCAVPKVDSFGIAASEWFSRLNTCVHQQNWELTELLADEMAKHDYQSPWPSYYRSLVALERGEYRRALWMLDLSGQKIGESGIFLYQRGKVLHRMGDSKGAVESIERALSLDPRLKPAQLYLAQTFRRERETEKANKYYSLLLQDDQEHREAIRFIADSHFENGRQNEAVSMYQKLMDLGTDDGSVYSKVGQHFEDLASKASDSTRDLLSALQVYRRFKAEMAKGKIALNSSSSISDKIKSIESRLETTKTKKQALNSELKPRGAK